MANNKIEKKLIHFNRKESFQLAIDSNSIHDWSIVFIKDSQEIYTHGTLYKCAPEVLASIEQNGLLSSEDKQKIDKIITNGSGKLFLNDKGEYDLLPEEVVITDGVEPLNGEEIWIDLSEDDAVLFVSEAPIDGKLYVRLNAAWREVQVPDIDTSALETSISSKVDKVEGKGLSTNDFTTEEKNKLANAVTNTELSLKGYLTSVPNEYVTDTELELKGYLTEHQSLADYALKSEIPDVSNISEVHIGDVAPTGNEEVWVDTSESVFEDSILVTEAPLDNKLYVRQDGDWSEVIIPEIDTSNLATKLYVDEATADLKEGELPANGVYILDTDGNYFTSSEWDAASNDKAVGVAVLADETKFVIGKEQTSSGMEWGGNGTDISTLTNYSSSSSAYGSDFDGEGNTDKIIAALGTSGTYAALACRNVTFPHGKSGYLGAAGQWKIAYDNKAEVDACMSAIGGEAILTGYHWSSSEYSSDNAWVMYWSGGTWINDTKGLPINHVRAFADIPTPKLPLKQYIDEKTSLSSYARSTETNEDLYITNTDTIPTALGKLEKAILDNELITATAITELNEKINVVGSYTTATTLVNLPVNYENIYVSLGSNETLSLSNYGSDYNGRLINIFVECTAAITITLPTTGNYISMSGSSIECEANKWCEISLIGINGLWHIATLKQN